MPDQERLIAHFSGYVQGVGFRFTTVDIASDFPDITGYVRNLPDGRVELVAEGTSDRTAAFLAAVTSAMEPHIHNVRQARQAPTGEFARFSIRR